MEINEYCENFKNQNGNVTYTTKELVQALHVKIDEVNKKMGGKVSYKIFFPTVGVLFSILILIIRSLLNGGT